MVHDPRLEKDSVTGNVIHCIDLGLFFRIFEGRFTLVLGINKPSVILTYDCEV